MQTAYNEFPNIQASFDQYNNACITSPSCHYVIPFYQTRDSLMDIETYKRFLDNAISRFRKSRTYSGYKGYLLNEINMDRCQFMSNINADMASIEMHHNMLTIYDIAVIITEHILNTVGFITTFDLVQLLKEEHKSNRIQLVMLSLTAHQLYHNSPDFYIHPSMCFGDWNAFLCKYSSGITMEIAFKILFYIKKALEVGGSDDSGLLKVRDEIINWSELNGNSIINDLGL